MKNAALAYPSTLKMVVACSSKMSLTLNGLHRFISQRIEVFVTTAVTTSNPTLFHHVPF
jgi:hypothetical protein